MGPNLTWLVSLWNYLRAQQEDHVSPLGDDSHLSQGERLQEEPEPLLELELELPELWENRFLSFKPSVLWYFLLAVLAKLYSFHQSWVSRSCLGRWGEALEVGSLQVTEGGGEAEPVEVTRQAEVGVMWLLESGGGGHKPRSAGGLKKLEKVRAQICP